MARVLVVEDDEDIRTLVGHRLRAGGHRTVLVGDGPSALAAVADRQPPEVLVLDVGLPGMDGFDVLQAIRAQVGAPDLPAIFLTARVLEADIERGRALGAAYLTKPFVAAALLKAVDEVVSAKQVAEEGW